MNFFLNALKYRRHSLPPTSPVSEFGDTDSRNHIAVIRKIRSHYVKLIKKKGELYQNY